MHWEFFNKQKNTLQKNVSQEMGSEHFIRVAEKYFQ